MENRKKVAFYTLGCKLNYAETATIERQFLEKGFSSVQFSEKADVYVINTCSVTSHADKKCRNIIKKAVKNAPGSFVAVVGCYSQLQSEQLAAIPGVDLVLGSREKLKMFDYVKDFSKKEQAEVHSCEILKIKEFDSSYSVSGRTRSFVKIQDGCDYFCSYCTIPLARGLSRSNTIERVIEDVKDVAARGAKEVVLTGVNIGDFGKGSDEKLIDLMRELEKINGIDRFRISSIEPNLLTDEIIEFMADSGKFVPHFHIPLQSGCDKILRLMNRKYLREVFADRVKTIKRVIPSAGIGADVIVGFPGESDEDFMDTYDFINALPISFLHVFSYSERENTKAAKLPGKLTPAETERRSKILHALGEAKRKLFYGSFIGSRADVLFEAYNKKGKMYGFTGNYIRVEADYDKSLINKTVTVLIKEEGEVDVMTAEIITLV
jgi:threonylcarbamoyladenosine tRNA methylthiotransferase MtaB